MSLVLSVVKFKGAERAGEVLDGYIELHPDESWPKQAAIIARHKLGRISIYQSVGEDWDDEDRATAEGMGIGGLTGALAGVLAGPAGLAVGTMLGGALGGIAGAADADEEPIYQVIRGKLAKDTSVILLLADDEIADRMLEELGPQGVDTLRREVRDELRGNLREAVREAAREPAAAPH